MSFAPSQVLTAITAAAAVAVATREYLTIHRQEAAKRAQIQKEKDLQIQAIKEAADVVLERLNRGVYDGDPMLLADRVPADLQFETIVHRTT